MKKNLKPVPEGKKGKGLSKLPTEVRNKDGFYEKRRCSENAKWWIYTSIWQKLFWYLLNKTRWMLQTSQNMCIRCWKDVSKILLPS